MRGALIILPLALAACEPKAAELDGAPSTPEGELAGGPSSTQVVLPGIINMVPQMDAKVLDNCEKIVAPDYDHPPRMACVYFLGDGPAPAAHSETTDELFLYQMTAAGWTYIRATGAERFFEKPKPGTDCADLAAMTVLEDDQVENLLKQAAAAAAPQGKAWRAYALTASVREACGADRMKP